MQRTFQDRNFLVWEVYSSGGKHGFSEDVNIVFHCLTQQEIRPRYLPMGMDEADAQKAIADAEPPDLVAMLERAREIA